MATPPALWEQRGRSLLTTRRSDFRRVFLDSRTYVDSRRGKVGEMLNDRKLMMMMMMMMMMMSPKQWSFQLTTTS
jgi:hypothetical protein